jgi:UDP-N-acetylmuramate dehydrogenase
LLEIATLDDLTALGPALARSGLPVCVLGNGSNLLVADDEFAGVVIKLGEAFRSLSYEGSDEVVVRAGAALDLPVAARRLSDQGIVGFEWAVGVPGTFGGAVVMNAGGHGGDMASAVTSARLWSLHDARVIERTAADLQFGYRQSSVSRDEIVLDVTMMLRRGDADASKEQLKDIVRWRREHQPGGANAGSVFRNPVATSAGHLIDEAGLKGYRVGGARVSEKHANFIQVDEGARASDVLELMAYVAKTVEEVTGVRLESEVRTVGFSPEES